MLKNCVSCGRQTKDYSLVPDPESDEKVARCKHCRQLSITFKTPGGVMGP